MDINLFLGRLHPLIVHLPIGFLILAIVLEWYNRQRPLPGRDTIIVFILLLGTVAATLSCVFGWILANQGGYQDQTLFFHRWLGIGTMVLAGLAWWSKKTGNQKLVFWSISCTGILLLLTGHFGGSLTHGADYLTQPLSGNVNKKNLYSLPASMDSIIVYDHLIQSVLDAKCISCHNNQKQNGGLNLASREGIEKGGDNGKVIANTSWDSELFKRITLPADAKKFMPPKGIPLTFHEVTILKWWLDEGAKNNRKLLESEISVSAKKSIITTFQIDPSPKSIIESVNVPSVSTLQLQSLQKQGWKIDFLGQTTNLVEVSLSNLGTLKNEMLDSLSIISTQITWLNLDKANITDEHLKVIAQYPNLTRLRLQNNKITDHGLMYLTALQHLESLNLYNNPITDSGLASLAEIKHLDRLYLWQTKVTDQGVANLKASRPDIKVER